MATTNGTIKRLANDRIAQGTIISLRSNLLKNL